MASAFEIHWVEHRPSLLQLDTFVLDFAELKELLEQQEGLEDCLSKSLALIDTVPGAQIAAQQVRVELQTARAKAQTVRAHIDKMWNMVPILLRPNSGVAASKVFSTTELLEEVLTYLPTRQKLECMQVQRCWYHSINGSVKLKRSLGLEPMDNEFYHSAFGHRIHYGRYGLLDRTLPGGTEFTDNKITPGEEERWDMPRDIDHVTSGQWAGEWDTSQVRLQGFFSHCIARRTMGSRVGDMRVCSPPILTWQATLLCTGCTAKDGTLYDRQQDDYLYDRQQGHPFELQAPSSEGFTVGSLHEALEQVLDEHESGHAPPRRDHYVYTRIEISATHYLREDDPECIEREELKLRAQRRAAEREREREAGWGSWEEGWGDATGGEDAENGDEQIAGPVVNDTAAVATHTSDDNETTRDQTPLQDGSEENADTDPLASGNVNGSGQGVSAETGDITEQQEQNGADEQPVLEADSTDME
ncbi:hypothetical protein CB0940_03924 [Cercospora beticola]|uniref:F-box domain-containing protein n=1 Tax=Cercospora beticola TaxID=122368 RepID=A0A2G5HLM2_CERBT|nr:hypothetical protein CB0940_03924 [Cercospora beticola]PIA93449.1 hypothetical protein CB0940_03924 [Cercospora beticola]WPB01126.1 hypothetical protein RHO25_005747 [Cercospora beticola]